MSIEEAKHKALEMLWEKDFSDQKKSMLQIKIKEAKTEEEVNNIISKKIEHDFR